MKNPALVELEEVRVSVVQTADLFPLKLRAGSPQDLLDATELLRMPRAGDRKAWGAAASRASRRDGFLLALEHHLAVFDPNILN